MLINAIPDNLLGWFSGGTIRDTLYHQTSDTLFLNHDPIGTSRCLELSGGKLRLLTDTIQER